MDRGVIATAFELFAARHYPGVVAVCADALEEEPECVPLLLLRARANVALRRDLDAQADLRDVIRLDPRSVLAYRLLGELAARCDENDSAAQYFREALRLDPDDREARDWLQVVDAPVAAPVPGSATGHRFPCVPHSAFPRPAEPGSGCVRSAPARPAAGAAKLPATAPAAGRLPSSPWSLPESSSPTGPSTSKTSAPSLTSGATGSGPTRMARGTEPQDHHLEERPTQPFGRVARVSDTGPTGVRVVKAQPAAIHEPIPTLTGRPAPQPPARPAPKLAPRTTTRMQIPELPGFGEYLVSSGVLTHERLRVAQAYQRSMKVQLSTAIITLGLASPQRIEWAAVAHQSQVAGELR